MKVMVKTSYKNQFAVRDYLVDQCKFSEEDLIIVYKGKHYLVDKMKVRFGGFRPNKLYKSKFNGGIKIGDTYRLVYFKKSDCKDITEMDFYDESNTKEKSSLA